MRKKKYGLILRTNHISYSHKETPTTLIPIGGRLLLPHLEKGYGIALSAFSKDSGKGHIVRLQGIESGGLRLDDPYGDVSKHLDVREAGNSGYYKKNEYDNLNYKSEETGKGENNLWLWKDVQKTTIKYAIIIKNE